MPPRSSHQSRQPSTATQADAETTGKSPPSEEMNRQRRQSGDPRHPTFSQDMAPRVESMTWSVVIPWTRCKAAYASHEKLAESKIRVRSFDFATGQNADLSPQFFEPLPPSTVAELFAQTGGFSDPSSDVVKPGEEDDDWLSPQQEAWTMVETIKRELFGPGWRGIIPQHSAWRCYGYVPSHCFNYPQRLVAQACLLTACVYCEPETQTDTSLAIFAATLNGRSTPSSEPALVPRPTINHGRVTRTTLCRTLRAASPCNTRFPTASLQLASSSRSSGSRSAMPQTVHTNTITSSP